MNLGEIPRLIVGAAGRYGLPPRLPLACAIAESGLDPGAERWGDRTAGARVAIAGGDWLQLEQILSDLDSRGLLADISFGLGQQSAMWAPENPQHLVSRERLLELRELYFDPAHAVEVMCMNLVDKYRLAGREEFRALCRYNWPAGGGQPASSGVAAAYRRGLEQAHELLAVLEAERRYVFPVEGYRGDVALHHGSHSGASDLFAPCGTPVLAMYSGSVDLVGYSRVGGNNVLLAGDDGLAYYYAHLQEPPALARGTRVAAGQQIGSVGQTGNAWGKGCHLHLGIGREIATGEGATGGAGTDFDAVSLLRRVLAGGPGAGVGSQESGEAQYRVAGTGGEGLNLRAEPSTTAEIRAVLPDGTTVKGGRSWRAVATLSGVLGWVADEYLEAVGSRQ
jgi:hypothetical protein